MKKMERCPDCAVQEGDEHMVGCDVARCKSCGRQELSCSHDPALVGMTTWTGRWPGDVEVEEGIAKDLVDLAMRAFGLVGPEGGHRTLYWDPRLERFYLNWKDAEQHTPPF